MNSLLLLIICVAILVVGYIFYGGWLCKQWGVGESNKPTPAHEMEDGVDYVPAKAPVLMGHHFSSIAGAGPITGPIGAAMFGWVPVVLWILVGGIFFGGVHDFGALFASIRHKGQSIGEIISTNMSKRAKLLFTIFAYLTLILVVAAFASIVATTFGATVDEATGAIDVAASATNASVAMVSLLFILIAIVFGFMVYRRNASMAVSTILGVVAIAACMAIGMNFNPEGHGLHVDGGAPGAGNVVHAAVDNGAGVVPGAEHGLDGAHELLLGVGGEVGADLGLVLGFELARQLLQVVGGQVHVLGDALLFLHFVDELFEVFLAHLHDHVGEHLDKAAVGVIYKALKLRVGVAGNHCLHHVVVEAQVQDGIHHAGHGGPGAGTDGIRGCSPSPCRR